MQSDPCQLGATIPNAYYTSDSTSKLLAEFYGHATIHAASTYFVEYRGWSQEVDVIHYETAEPGQRFEARGKATPLDMSKKLSAFAATPSDAIYAFKRALESDDWQKHYRGIMDRIEEYEREIERLKATPPASSAPQPTASSNDSDHG